MKYLIKIFFVYLILLPNVIAQSLWLFDYGYNSQFNHLVENLSVDSLKNIVLFDDWNQSPLLYEGAVTRLYYFHKETESQFLINNLNTEIDSIGVPEWAINLEWDKYYTDAYILGHLGSPTAIDKMRVIADDENNYYRLRAIGHLAETDIYDYYNFLKSEYYSGNEDPYILFLISLYSRNESYKDEIKNILRNEVYSQSDYFGVINRAHYLGFIPGAEVEILDEFFRSTNGKERYDYFRDLGFYDKEGQTGRSMFALKNEVNDTFRVEYLPSPDMVISRSNLSKRYLEPMFVNFLTGLNVSDPSSMTYQIKEFFLLAFVPVPPDSERSSLDLLNNLYNYVDSVYSYNWLGDLTFSNELKNILNTAKTNLKNGDSLACRVDVKAFQDSVDFVYKDSLNTDPRFVTIEGWKFLYWNAQYILDRLPEPQTNPNLLVNLKNSLGNQIPANNVMYYEGSWKDAVNNGDGTFTVITSKPTVSIRMFYEYANQTVNNVPAQNNTYTFTTVNASVQLKNSSGNLIDEGTVQYYAGAWRSFGTTINGVAYKELLPVNYSFRMTYEYVSNDKQQNLSGNPVVDFNTVLCTVKVTKVNNQPLEGANTKYYSIAWRDIGLTDSNGEITKELLPKNLSFRATYNNVSQDKQQDISVNNLVEIMLNVP